ncbi:DUF5368 domain-containing protein [Lentibacter sp. XHP0401]|jgi:Family of unknown function (DUF5368)|uniref:DUF5368 domain-containing protein n=1 Tax=Lentibacter sp. XHP0401 TaxID=2984334 RepID=UPI0021E9003F|nr:DUF5368 domain-containing protein [Lentibacter sp. XHP0401]MCV2892855.1 DUF5368 domain-containing protein [Lentibacter sp. XHP0401]
MQDLTFTTLLAVFEEIFGRGLFWAMVVAAAVVTLLYIFVLIRDRAVSWRKFLWAQLSMPIGAIAAVMFVQGVTRSGFSDIGGPIDVIVLLGVAAGGAIGMAILVYTVQSLFWRQTEDS